MNDNQESKLSNIIFKSINNKITHIKLDINLPIIELLSIIYNSLVDKSNISYDIKFIYSGKVLQHQNSFISYGVKEDHVVLYMLRENETEIKIENNSIIENNLNNISNISSNNQENSNNRRGFDRLLDWGTSQTEIYNMRLLFHASYMINNRVENYENREFWTREAIYQREEEWYNNNERNNLDNISNAVSRFPIEQNYLRNLLLIRSQRRNRENSVLLVENGNNNQEDIINSNISSERNIMFVIGLIIGFFLRYFVIFYICLCPIKPKLKLGLLFGGLISSIIVLIMTSREREL